MTAITRSPLGVLRADAELMAMLERAAWETIAVGRAHGVPLADAVMDEVLAMMRGLPPHGAVRRCSRTSSAAGRSSCRG